MAAFFPYLSIVFFSLLLGLSWRSPGPSTYLDEYALSSISRALYVSWLLVFVSYWLGLGNLFYVLLALVLFLHAWRRPIKPLAFSVSGVFLFVFVAAFWIWSLTKDYNLIYHGWDTVVSWNRWGMELYKNKYMPLNAAYPIFFPGLWSLIYKVQGNTNIWIFSKATLWILPFIVLLALTSLYRINMLVAVVVGYFATSYFVNYPPQTLMSGWMDMPSAALGFASLLLLLVVCHEVDANKAKESIYGRLAMLAPLFGVLAIVKQPGFGLTVFFVCWLAYFAIKGIISRRQFAGLLTVVALPVLSYYVIFLSVGGHSVGNLSYLLKLSASKSHGHLMSRGFQFLVSDLGLYPIIALLLLGCLNFLRLGNLKAKMGVWALSLFIAGALAYCYFFSYDDRNALWLFAPLAVSAAAGLLEFMPRPTLEQTIHHVRQWRLNWLAIGGSVGAAFVLSLAFPYQYLVSVDAKLNRELIPNPSMVLQAVKSTGKGAVIVSGWAPMGFSRSLAGKFALIMGSYKSIGGYDSGHYFDLCGDKRVHARSLTAIIACGQKPLVYITRHQSDTLKKTYPRVTFDLVASKGNWVILRPETERRPGDSSDQ